VPAGDAQRRHPRQGSAPAPPLLWRCCAPPAGTGPAGYIRPARRSRPTMAMAASWV